MESNVNKHLNLPYSTVVVPDVTTEEEPCYMAYHPELEGCMSHGDTPEEALHNLSEVRRLYISALIDDGLEIPLPQGTRANWEIVSLTGQKEESMSPSPELLLSFPAITPPIFEPVL